MLLVKLAKIAANTIAKVSAQTRATTPNSHTPRRLEWVN